MKLTEAPFPACDSLPDRQEKMAAPPSTNAPTNAASKIRVFEALRGASSFGAGTSTSSSTTGFGIGLTGPMNR